MKIPKILYHGTSVWRWLQIQRDGIMRCNVRKDEGSQSAPLAALLVNANRTSDYLYFSNRMEDTCQAGVRASIADMRFYRVEKPDKQMEELAVKYGDIMVLALKTSNIRDRVDIDPEVVGYYNKKDNNDAESILWYRVKGDISTKYLFPYRQLSLNAIPKHGVDAMIKILEIEKNAYSSVKENPHLRGEIVRNTSLKINEIAEEARLQAQGVN